MLTNPSLNKQADEMSERFIQAIGWHFGKVRMTGSEYEQPNDSNAKGSAVSIECLFHLFCFRVASMARIALIVKVSHLFKTCMF